MNLTRRIEEIGDGRKCVALGFFDGVHKGHQALVRNLVQRASGIGGTAIVITFDPHPLRVINPADAPPYLTDLKEKAALLEALGVDEILVLSFDRAFASLSPEAFVKGVIGALKPDRVIVGYNFTFGYRGIGTATTLGKLGTQHSFEVDVVDPVVRSGFVVSSTLIRKMIRQGMVSQARDMLGRVYTVPGVLNAGSGELQRFLSTPGRALPGPGVYAVCFKEPPGLGVALVQWPGPRISVKTVEEPLREGARCIGFVQKREAKGEECPAHLSKAHLEWAGQALWEWNAPACTPKASRP